MICNRSNSTTQITQGAIIIPSHLYLSGSGAALGPSLGSPSGCLDRGTCSASAFRLHVAFRGSGQRFLVSVRVFLAASFLASKYFISVARLCSRSGVSGRPLHHQSGSPGTFASELTSTTKPCGAGSFLDSFAVAYRGSAVPVHGNSDFRTYCEEVSGCCHTVPPNIA